MEHLLGSGMYPLFPPFNFSGMSSSYVVPSQVGLLDTFMLSQGGHGRGVNQNFEWMNMCNRNLPVHDGGQRTSTTEKSKQFEEPNPLSSRQPTSSAGEWINPRSRRRESIQSEHIAAREGHSWNVQLEPDGSMGNRKQKAVGLQYSELRNSPPTQSAET